MRKLNLLTYADDLYRPMQAKLVEHAQSLHAFDVIYTETRDHLLQTEFYKENKYILDKPRGGGYCAWKPYFILETLSKMKEGDILLYMDSADWIENGDVIRDELFDLMKNRYILLTDGAYKHSDWTRRDTFFYMHCDTPEYHNAIQLEAGIVLMKNCPDTRLFISKWMWVCGDPRIITEDDNVCGLPNLDGFKEHRYDQSVLTNLKIANNVESGNQIRKFVHCNVNMPQ